MSEEFKQSEMPIWFEDLCDGTHDNNRIYKVYGKGGTVSWQDFSSAACCFSEHHDLALAYIKRFLGYVPKELVYMPHMAFIQALLEKSESGQMDIELFWQEMTEQMKLLRNDDMRKSGWLNHVTPRGDSRDIAKRYLVQHARVAYDRISKLLEFKPKSKYSLEAELYLRGLFERDDFTPDLPFGNMDYEAATATLYRMHYFENGELPADQSELIALKHDALAQMVYLKNKQDKS